jgi:chromosome segregation ATPase
VVTVLNVDTKEHLALKREVAAANGRIKELENSQEILREKKARLEQELAIMQEKLRQVESSERSQALKLSELEETSKATTVEVTKVS